MLGVCDLEQSLRERSDDWRQSSSGPRRLPSAWTSRELCSRRTAPETHERKEPPRSGRMVTLERPGWNRVCDWLSEVENLRQSLSWGGQTASGGFSGPPGP